MRAARAGAWALSTVLLLTGCRSRPELASTFDAELARDELKVTSVDLRSLAALELFEVRGPPGARVSHLRLDWSLGDKPLGVTDTPLDTFIEQDGHAALSTRQSFSTARTLTEVQALARAGRARLRSRGVLTLDWHGGLKELPVGRATEVDAPRLPVPTRREATGARYDNGEMSLVVRLSVENPNPFPVQLQRVEYQLLVRGEAVATGVVGQADWIPAASARALEVDAFLDLSRGELLDELRRLGRIPYEVRGQIVLDGCTEPFSLEGDTHI